MFEKASRLKLRFKTQNGIIAVDDLWDLTLDSLNTLAKALNKEVKESAEESFIEVKSAKDALVLLKFDIVKHIISVKLAERDAQKLKIEKSKRRNEILKVLEQKQDESLKAKSQDELLKELEALDD